MLLLLLIAYSILGCLEMYLESPRQKTSEHKESEERTSFNGSPTRCQELRWVPFMCCPIWPIQQTSGVSLRFPSPTSLQMVEPILLAPESEGFIPSQNYIASQGNAASQKQSFQYCYEDREMSHILGTGKHHSKVKNSFFCDHHFSIKETRNLLVQDLKSEDERFTCGRW